MIRVIGRRSPLAPSWASATQQALGGDAQSWSSETCALVLESEFTDHCAASANDRAVVVFRGAIFPPDDEALGSRYDASSIAEAMLRRFCEHGVDALLGIWGRYEIYILDRVADCLILITDPYGGSAAVNYVDADEHYVASSPSALRAGGVELAVDRQYEDFLLVYGFVPHAASVFRHVKQVGAAQLIRSGTNGVDQQTYEATGNWKPSTQAQDEQSAITALHEGFLSAIEEMAPAGEDVAVLLGGFDSALVVAGLAELGKNVHTYTFRYADERYNQAFVEELAEITGSVANWVEIDSALIAEGFERYRDEVGAPTNWPAYVIQTRAVCEQIRRDGFNVALSGDGCDNLFFGYPLTFRRGQVTNQLSRLPGPILGVGEMAASNRFVQDLLGRPAVVGAGVLRNAQLEHPARGFLTFRVMEETALKRLRGASEPENMESVRAVASELAAPFSDADDVQLAYQGKKCVSPSALKKSASSLSAGVSIVSPYQHYGMVALAKSLPTELLRPSGQDSSTIGKFALANMAESTGLLPPEIIHQPKLAAADAPIDEWYPGPLRGKLEGLIGDLPFDAEPAMVAAMFEATLGERLYQRIIGAQTNNVANVSHDVSLLATYGALAGLAA